MSGFKVKGFVPFLFAIFEQRLTVHEIQAGKPKTAVQSRQNKKIKTQ